MQILVSVNCIVYYCIQHNNTIDIVIRMLASYAPMVKYIARGAFCTQVAWKVTSDAADFF